MLWTRLRVDSYLASVTARTHACARAVPLAALASPVALAAPAALASPAAFAAPAALARPCRSEGIAVSSAVRAERGVEEPPSVLELVDMVPAQCPPSLTPPLPRLLPLPCPPP